MEDSFKQYLLLDTAKQTTKILFFLENEFFCAFFYYLFTSSMVLQTTQIPVILTKFKILNRNVQNKNARTNPD